MKRVMLTHGYSATVDDADYDAVRRHRWYALRTHQLVYAARRVGSRIVLMHRAVLRAPCRRRVDHVDGDGLNNRRRNLRLCSHAQNIRNSRKQRRRTSSRYKGVWWAAWARRWRAAIMVDGRAEHLGYFHKESAAARAYDAAARARFKQFAAVNFPRAGERGGLA